MDTKTNGVEAPVVPAPMPPEPTVEKAKEDLSFQVYALTEELKKTASDRDNYKKGLLKARGQDEPLTEEEVERRVQERLAEEAEKKLARDREELLVKQTARIKELENLVSNRPQGSVSSGVHTEDRKTGDPLVSDAQVKHFKSLGWDDKKIEAYKKNFARLTNRI